MTKFTDNISAITRRSSAFGYSLAKPVIWLHADMKEHPLRYVGPGFIVADGLMTAAGGVDKNPYMIAASGLGVVTNFVFMLGGDGGDPEKRTKKQIARARVVERFALYSTAVSSALYCASGMLGHVDKVVGGEIFIGTCVLAGVACGLFSKTPVIAGRVSNSVRALKNFEFKKAADELARLTPYKKSAICWTASNIGLASAIWETGNPYYMAAMAVYLLTNRQLAIANRAEHSLKTEAVKPQP